MQKKILSLAMYGLLSMGVFAFGCKPDPEVCGDGIDNDENGATDCDDEACAADGLCNGGEGDDCAVNDDCDGGSCLDETGTGFPGGYCSSDCDPTADETGCFGDDAVCLGVDFFDPTIGVCLDGCAEDTDCRDGYACVDADGAGTLACLPACDADAQCGETGFCDVDPLSPSVGLCAVPEANCEDFADDDGDDLIDCSDPTECQGTAACEPGAGALGDDCDANTDCAATGGDPVCLADNVGFPVGLCSEFCDANANDCDGDGRCLDLGTDRGLGVCFDTCEVDADCARPGFVCQDFFGDGQNICFAQEDCGNGIDDDLDGLADCEDVSDDNSGCAADATCAAQIGDACSAAVALAEGANNGDNGEAGDSSLFSGLCPGFFGDFITGDGTPEDIFSFTSATPGELVLDLAPDAVDLALYARGTCEDAGTQLACADAGVEGDPESITVGVDANSAVTIFVDGFAGQVGTYTLNATFTAAICGDGQVVLPEACDDGNTTAGDGCDAACAVEENFACEGEPSVCTDLSATCDAAVPAVIGANAGDTTGGTALFEGSCTGGDGALESLFSFTPAADGTLTLTLASVTDQGIYVRTSCADDTTELACIDAQFGGTDEILTIDVTAGQALTIFVDGFLDPAEAGPFTLTLAQ